MALVRLRDWALTADLARQYATDGDNDRQGVGWAHATVGQCLLAGDRPDPAGAAHAGLHADLRRRWPDLAEVTQLGDALADGRAALSSGSAPARKALPPAQGA